MSLILVIISRRIVDYLIQGPYIKYVSTFLAIFDPPPLHVSNCQQFDPLPLKRTSAEKVLLFNMKYFLIEISQVTHILSQTFKILKPHSQSSKGPVRPMSCNAKPSYIYTIFKKITSPESVPSICVRQHTQDVPAQQILPSMNNFKNSILHAPFEIDLAIHYDLP